MCPVTKTVDLYDVEVEYVPRSDSYIEFQSFKEYLRSFRGCEHYHEELVDIIARTLCEIGCAKYVKVSLRSMFAGLNIEVVEELNCT